MTTLTEYHETWKGLPIKHTRQENGTWRYSIFYFCKGGSYGVCGCWGHSLAEARKDAHELAEEVLQRPSLIVPQLLEDGTYEVVETGVSMRRSAE